MGVVVKADNLSCPKFSNDSAGFWETCYCHKWKIRNMITLECNEIAAYFWDQSRDTVLNPTLCIHGYFYGKLDFHYSLA